MKSNEKNLYSQTFGNHYFLVAVSLSLVFIFMGLLLDRIDSEFDQAEQTQFGYRLAELKAAVRLMEADLISQGELQLAEKFEGANPMDWMDDQTSHYLGNMSSDKALKYPGNWFFDPVREEIAYVSTKLKLTNNNNENNHKILRFKVRALMSIDTESKFNGLVLTEVQADMPLGLNSQQ